MVKRLHILISGRVQGVFFRDNTKKLADDLHLFGWVRNLSDGRVEVLAEGEEADLQELLNWCHMGSSIAKVEDVFFEWQESQKDMLDFKIV